MESQAKQYPLIIGNKEAEEVTGLSLTKLNEMVAAGQAPGKIKVGKLFKWSRLVLERWVEAGCPPVSQMDAPQAATA